MCGLAVVSLGLHAASAHAAAGKLFYGSRAGMQVSIVGISGIGTRNASIQVAHTPEDAKAFCMGYANDPSKECITRTLADTHINRTLGGNCETGTFTSLYGEKLRFLGRLRGGPASDGVRYVIMRGRERLDGSMASGYDYDLAQFAALCPNRAPTKP